MLSVEARVPQADEVAALDWWCAFLPGRTERKFAAAAGCLTFLPIETVRRADRPRELYQRPLFPNCVFGFGERSAAYCGTIRPHEVAQVPWFDRRRISELMEDQRRGLPLMAAQPLAEGINVRVVSGPFAGHEGRVKSLTDRFVVVHLERYGAFGIPVENGTLLSVGSQVFERAEVEALETPHQAMSARQAEQAVEGFANSWTLHAPADLLSHKVGAQGMRTGRGGTWEDAVADFRDKNRLN